jgi:prepilin-type N-terminal cleavage/methylation domain-containing protein
MVLIKIKNLMSKNPKGFTLIEMLVAMAIFSTVMGIVTGIFITGIRQQKMALDSQIVLDQTSYALEYMSRALRFASKEKSGGACLSQDGLNFEIPVAYQIEGNENLGTGLRFINHLQGDDCQEFFLENNQIKYWRQSDPNPPVPLTSVKLEVISLKFDLEGKRQTDNLQPRITIFSEIKSAGASGQSQKIQTSISQRNLDVPY